MDSALWALRTSRSGVRSEAEDERRSREAISPWRTISLIYKVLSMPGRRIETVLAHQQ